MFIERGVAKTFAAQQTSADANRAAEVKARLAAKQRWPARGGEKRKRKVGWSAHGRVSVSSKMAAATRRRPDRGG